ncbi:thiol reductant ABC exporter subunit CydC [Microlunatus parietis]|uniref:Thiol reductant ABC exporter CydC subunit n=1 Tax=Microlunatus parietis TaxID=682979 RepID=A0A7Y9LDW1_9ACTN|nr:thiol reductant ABC exporter subunit CydC [Microlunatus parietis]NYE72391.1 thiol reductant ABC exporter CydC subunit [Microlunatus parietis]
MIIVDRRRLAGAVGLGVLAQAAAVGLLATSAWLLSRAAEHPPVLYLLVAVVAVRALGLGRGVFRYLERLVGHDVALRAQAALRLDSYRALARTTWLGRRGGDLLSRMINDVEAIQDVVVRVIVPITAAALVIVGAQIMITVIAPAAGLATLVCVAVAAGPVPLLAARLSAGLDRWVALLRGALAEAVAEATEAAPDLIAYGPQVALDRVRRADERLRRAEQRAALAQGVAAAGQTLGVGAAVIGALLLGSAGLAAGTVPPVQLAVLALTPLALAEVVAAIPPAVQTLSRAKAALGRVRQVIEAPAVGTGDRPDGAATTRPGVRLAGVTAGWPDGPVVVSGLDLELRPGQRVGLIGPSGSGKTTVAATIMGLIPATAGTVDVRGRVGYLAQDAYLFDTTVAENLRLGRREADDRELIMMLHRVGLDLELDRLVGVHGTRLSGGEARRLALARVLLTDPDVLILDEPTEHLDGPTAERLLADLDRLSAGVAVLMITHDPRVARRCDRLIDLGRTVDLSVAERG